MFLSLNLNDSTTECWTEEYILFVIPFGQKDFCIRLPDTKLSVHSLRRDQHWTSLASLHFAQSYPSSISKTWQSWCRELKAFYQTSLRPLYHVFCHVYEKRLKLLEIGNIHLHQNMVQNQATNSSVSIFKWIYIDNVSKKICSSQKNASSICL